ncbi:hypothetical protein HELRODRAFT_98638 [Helobdella robusta]|uniref:Trimeric intracellular cation channel type B n=1 Tax=Helobdella robusta TaxID=6412 RepID=T1G9N9_HELRO|nr:hypothetical protein HELRODRAFT_98638 [Helobdella robusta]ESO07281.1 hypothetical protein HELRODRAFT_98638 [Helobdella robusta]
MYEAIYNVAVTVKRFKMFPIFEVAHYILTCLSVREYTMNLSKGQISKDSQVLFSRAHPLCDWFGNLLMCFAGSFLGNFLLGEPLITPLQNTKEIVIITVVWYLINYSPFDVFFNFINLLPVKFILNLLKEVRRVNKVDQGINFALKVMPDTHIVPLAFGILKGTATNHMKVFHRLTCGVWQPSSIELLNPSIVTKTTFLGALLLFLHRSGHLSFIPEPILYLFIVVFFLNIKLLSYFKVDPFVPVENLLGCLFTGGVLDSLKRAVQQTSTGVAGTRLGINISESASGNVPGGPGAAGAQKEDGAGGNSAGSAGVKAKKDD